MRDCNVHNENRQQGSPFPGGGDGFQQTVKVYSFGGGEARFSRPRTTSRTKRAKRRSQLFCQRLGLLPSREVTAFGKLVEMDQVRIGALVQLRGAA